VKDALREIPERPEAYPSCRMFGTLPAYGFYVRHAKNIEFHHLDLGFQNEDLRPALVFDDVKDLEIFDLDAESTPLTKALIWFKHVDGAFVHGCRPPSMVTTLLQVDGDRSNNITVMNNDMSNVKHALDMGKGTREHIVYLCHNRSE